MTKRLKTALMIQARSMERALLKSGFIGAGTVGSNLALRLTAKGYPVVAVSSRSHIPAEKLAKAIPGCRAVNNQTVAEKADLVFITTPDDIIGHIAAEVKWHQGQNVVHCSGADSTAVLEPARKSGSRIGTFHPLQTFTSDKGTPGNIAGTTFAIEAEEPLLTILKDMATALDGRWIVLKAGDKVIYHAGAVMACNYLVTLVKIATDLWATIGISPQEARLALLPLLKGTIHNIETTPTLSWCLTGPIARGDAGTIKKHLDKLEEAAPELLSVYRELGRQTIPLALDKGRITQRQAEEIKNILEEPQGARKFIVGVKKGG
ncbi:MAG: DUF2520 domain-containing protein [Dehalococcoidales bacterium]|nr:DUF2520 domain-containing protein [Dehalococcoidales bacterium]